MDQSRVRAQFSILRELLGEPDEDHGMDKTSTCFSYVFDGRDVYVYDFHKEEWGDNPKSQTDSHYVWNIDGHDVAPFCRWLGDEIVKRMQAGASGRSLDQAGKTQLNDLLAAGVPLREAMANVPIVALDQSDQYQWPLGDEDATEATSAPFRRSASLVPAPKPHPVLVPNTSQPPVRRRGADRNQRSTPLIDVQRRRYVALQLLFERAGETPSLQADMRLAVSKLSSLAQRFVSLAIGVAYVSETDLKSRLAAPVDAFEAACVEIDDLLRRID